MCPLRRPLVEEPFAPGGILPVGKCRLPIYKIGSTTGVCEGKKEPTGVHYHGGLHCFCHIGNGASKGPPLG